ncbi:hypothetical protein KAU88_00640 [Candidatus Bathyarchaeota archaeon]|nr:hypothetical protein [Candidatus Bathyarchaeota archaeon]
MRIVKDKKGQFIIIAVMMIAIMMVSIAVTMYGVATYYKYEMWEEYITMIDHIKLNTIRLVEISLANYTTAATENNSILRDSLARWQIDLRKAYPGHGIALTYELANSSYQAYNAHINYTLGLSRCWNETASFSAANATFTLNMASVGLTGYKFRTAPFLNLTIITVDNAAKEITVAVKGEDGTPITNLKEDNFQVDGLNITAVTSRYDPKELFLYTIKCDGPMLGSVTVTVWDVQGIQVVAKSE